MFINIFEYFRKVKRKTYLLLFFTVHFRLVCGATFFGVQLTGWHQFEWQVSVRRPALFTSQMSGKSDRVCHVKVKEWYKYLILKSPPTPSGGHVYKEVSVNANWRMWPVGIVQLPWRKDSFLRSWQSAEQIKLGSALTIFGQSNSMFFLPQ